MMMKICIKSIGVLFASVLLLSPILAVDDATAQTPSRQKCAAPAEPENGQQAAPENNGRDLSRKLDDCNGVLEAPGVGDGELVEPAPETGKSRVIRPDMLPPDANPSNKSGN